MILLSDFKDASFSHKSRVIAIKPLNIVQTEDILEDSESTKPTEDIQAVQTELDKAYEELKQVHQQKNTLIEKTKQDIRDAKEQWENEKKVLIEEAKAKGYSDGFEQGRQESLKDYQAMLTEANAMTSLATQDYHQQLHQAEQDILSLAVHISKKILHQELSEHPESFLSLVSQAIKEVKEQPMISLYLHPNEYQMVIQQKSELNQVLGEQAGLAIYIDYKLNPGSCMIEHLSGQIDASIDTQLHEIKAHLLALKAEST